MPPRAIYCLLPVVGALHVLGFGESPTLGAQAPTTYAGDYTLAGQRGQATYDYRLSAGDTTRVGAFSFRAFDADSLLSDGGDDLVEVDGQFGDDGYAYGGWRFAFGELVASDVVEVRDLRYHLAVDGVRRRTEAQFEAGEAEGEWVSVTERVRRSRAVDTLFSSRIGYAAGVPQQSLTLESGVASLLGLVTRDGLAEDAWELYSVTGEREAWRFHDGLLQNVTLGGTATPVFEGHAGDTLHVALDEAYLRLLGEWLAIRAGGGDADDLAGSDIARLLRLNAAAYAEINGAIAALGLRGDGPRIRVAVPAAALAPREEARLERISAALVRFGVEADALLGDPALRRLATADDEAAFLRATAVALRDDLVAPARRLDTAYHQGLLRSLPLAAYLRVLYPDGSVPAALPVAYDGPGGARERTYDEGAGERFDVGGEGLPAVQALVDYAVERVTDIRARLSEKIDAVGGVDPDLVAGASRIEVTYARLDSLVDAQPRRLVRDVHLNRVRRVAEDAVNAYRGLDALGRQRRTARLSTCLDDLYALAVTLRNLPAYETRIEDAYTDEVWNNIIATVMTERVKKRITEAYRERLVPHYLERVRDELTCDNAAAIAADLTAVYERVLDLRDADTETLEDELRGVREPERLLGLLGVTPSAVAPVN